MAVAPVQQQRQSQPREQQVRTSSTVCSWLTVEIWDMWTLLRQYQRRDNKVVQLCWQNCFVVMKIWLRLESNMSRIQVNLRCTGQTYVTKLFL